MKVSKRKKEFGTFRNDEESYSLEEAVNHLKKVPSVKFDETVELHFQLNIDPKGVINETNGLCNTKVNPV